MLLTMSPIRRMRVLFVVSLLGMMEVRAAPEVVQPDPVSPDKAVQALCRQDSHYSHVDVTADSISGKGGKKASALCVCSPKWAAMRPSLRINTTSAEPLATAAGDGFHDLLTYEAFCRIGKKVTVSQVSGLTALNLANQGVDDGTVLRIKGMIEDKFPNLVIVPESMMVWDFVAFTALLDVQIKDWSSLKPYNVAYNRGWIILEKNITDAKSVVRADNTEQLFSLLKNNRVDLIVYEKWQGRHQLKARAIEGVRQIEPPLASHKLYAYLNRRHQALAAPLAKAFANMKAEGVYWPIYHQTLAPLTFE